jgi:hypothetical protein
MMITQAKAVENKSLMTDFVSENDCVICEPVCNRRPDLVAFL